MHSVDKELGMVFFLNLFGILWYNSKGSGIFPPHLKIGDDFLSAKWKYVICSPLTPHYCA